MAEFVRKKRFLKWKDDTCKKFLRKDFDKQCAYCKIREGDLGGPDSFEIDHFMPKSLGGNDNYENLYYSCCTCNGKAGKSNNWSLSFLDPCIDDIYGVHIKLMDDYSLQDQTVRGKEYIQLLKLNRKSYVRKRKCIEEHKIELRRKLHEYQQLYVQLRDNRSLKNKNNVYSIIEDDIRECETILALGANYRESKHCYDEDIDERVSIELGKKGDLSDIDEDFDLHYKLEIRETTYKCHVRIDEFDFDLTNRTERFIRADMVSVWKNIEPEYPILLVFFNRKDQRIYYVRFSEILKNSGVDNDCRCGFYINSCDTIDDLT